MNISHLLLILSGLCYLAAFVLHWVSFASEWEKGVRPAFFLLRLGFLLATFYFAAEAVEHGFFLPVANLSQAMAFLSWALAFVYLVLLVRSQNESFGFVLTPLLALFVAVSVLTLNQAVRPIPDLLNPYFTVHIISAFFAYASFTLSFAASILYLIQYHELKVRHAGRFYHKLPSLEDLERLIYQPVLWGVPLLLAAAVIGFVWSKSAYGEFWILDPKTLAITLTLAIYVLILYLYYVSSFRGKQVVVLNLIAFFFVLFTFVGTRFIHGSHNFLQ